MGLLSKLFGKPAEGNASVSFGVSMSCSKCVKRIEDLMAADEAVVATKIDLASKTVDLQYDKDRTTAGALKENIEKLGFEVEIR